MVPTEAAPWLRRTVVTALWSPARAARLVEAGNCYFVCVVCEWGGLEDLG